MMTRKIKRSKQQWKTHLKKLIFNNNLLLFTEVEVNSGGYLPRHFTAR